MSREAMQMALKALEDYVEEYGPHEKNSWAAYVITALRQALETEQEPGTWREVTYDQLMEEVRNRGYEIRDAKITVLRQARSLTDELMACVDRLGSEADTVDPRVWDHLLVYAPKHEKEPVAWMHNFIEGGISIGKKPTDLNRHPDRWTALYKDPTPCKTCQALAMAVMNDQTYHEKIIPKRQWVGLTAYEIQEIYSGNQHWGDFASAIEAKLKEKNT